MSLAWYLDESIAISSIIEANISYVTGTMKDNVYPIFKSSDFKNHTDAMRKIKKLGYRYIMGITSSNTLIELLPWFARHPDMYMINGTSASSEQVLTNRDTPNVYRLVVPNSYSVPIFNRIIGITSAQRVVILMQVGDSFSESLAYAIAEQLQIPYEIISVINTYDIEQAIPELNREGTTTCICMTSPTLLDYLYVLLDGTEHGYYVSQLTTPPDNVQGLDNRYYFIQYNSIYEHMVNRLRFNFGPEDSYLRVYDMINYTKHLACGNTVIGSNGYFYFNEHKDRNFIYYFIYLWNGSVWSTKYQYLQVGNANYWLDENPELSVNLPYSLSTLYYYPQTQNAKIAFLMLKSLYLDQEIVRNIGDKYKICYIDEVDMNKLLKRLYCRGYRCFVGCDTTTKLLEALPFFQEHTDCTLISLYSTATIPRNNINVIRMLPPDSLSYGIYAQWLNRATNNCSFIVEEDDIFSLQLFEGVKLLLNTNYDVYYINSSTSNEEWDRIVQQTNITGHRSMLCSANIREPLYSRLRNTTVEGLYIEGGSTTAPVATSNCYFLAFQPPNENVKNPLLYDVEHMARNIVKYGTADRQIGSYGYFYFDLHCDRNVMFYTLQVCDKQGDWSIIEVYNNIENRVFQSR